MKTLRNSILCLGVVVLQSSTISARHFWKYRGFALGTVLATVLKQTQKKPVDVKVINARPTLIQDLNWWPPAVPGASYRADSVEQMLFSFCNGELYKISVTYDVSSTQGLTTDDMVKSISAKYGPATILEPETDSVLNARFSNGEKTVASWEDSQYFFKLIRSPFTNRFGLTLFSTLLNAEVQIIIATPVTLDKQEKPQRDADLKKKEVDDLEAERQKNQKAFRP